MTSSDFESSAFENVHGLILAGGSGTRFWPASRRLRPKQLLPLGPAAPETLLRATVRRLSSSIPKERLWIATGAHLVEATRRELPELRPSAFLVEPRAKNTAPCIGWGAALLAAEDPEAICVVIPSDQHVERPEEFARVLARAVASAREGYITTIGIVPTRPETGYGYIELGDASAPGARAVLRFVEKPDVVTAEAYMKSQRYLWNAGLFVFRASDMVRAFQEFLPDMHAALIDLVAARAGEPAVYERKVSEFFDQVESISIDYGIMEKSSALRVVPGDFGWSDLGSWESAWELSAKDEAGNAGAESALFFDAANNLVQNLSEKNPGKTIALVGVEDLCVVETDDALLILPRERSQDVRLVVEELKRRRLEERF